MSLWLIVIALSILASGFLIWPFLASGKQRFGSSADVYRAQLAELKSEESSGIVSSEDARLARVEVQRRLIRASEPAAEFEVTPMSTADRITMIGIVAVVVIGSALTYSIVGRPNVPSTPSRLGVDLSEQTPLSPVDSAQRQQVDSVDSMLRQLEIRLQNDPDDVEGWRMLGWSKFRTEDYLGASAAYKRAVELDPSDGLIQSAYAETLIRSQNGFISNQALEALTQAVAINPEDARARFLIGLHKQQGGNAQDAPDDWLTLLNSASQDADWFNDVHGRVVELSTASGIDVSDRLPELREGSTSQSNAIPNNMPIRGPTRDQVQAAETMSASDREAMITGMVASLDARLRENPDDLDGWLQLIQSYLVLNQPELANQALERAKFIFADRPQALTQLDEAHKAGEQ